MTKQESFKKRIRTRMEKTGERYVAARRTLIEQAGAHEGAWVYPPEMSDNAIRSGTGKGWDEWREVIDAWPGKSEGHTAIAAYLEAEHGVDPWWAQGVTVGYERITGLRLPYQRPDGTFTASKSRTVQADSAMVRALLLDEDDRPDLFPGVATELLSRRTAKSVRLGIGGGCALLTVRPKSDGRANVAIEHSKLSTFDSVVEWKFYWSDWLDAIDQKTVD